MFEKILDDKQNELKECELCIEYLTQIKKGLDTLYNTGLYSKEDIKNIFTIPKIYNSETLLKLLCDIDNYIKSNDFKIRMGEINKIHKTITNSKDSLCKYFLINPDKIDSYLSQEFEIKNTVNTYNDLVVYNDKLFDLTQLYDYRRLYNQLIDLLSPYLTEVPLGFKYGNTFYKNPLICVNVVDYIENFKALQQLSKKLDTLDIEIKVNNQTILLNQIHKNDFDVFLQQYRQFFK